MKRTVKAYLFLSALYRLSMSTTNATYVTFLIGHGLNLFQVNLVNLVFYLTMMLAEIPTGAIADVYGRKVSFLCACLINAAGLYIYSQSTTFMGFALAEFTIAVGFTCCSGAFQAWLVDQLKHEGYEKPAGPIFARENQIDYATGTISGLVGTLLIGHSAALPWLVGAIAMAATGGFAYLLMQEEYHHRPTSSIESGFNQLWQTTKVSLRYAAGNGPVRFILMIGLVQYFAIQPMNMYWQPFVTDLTHSKSYLGVAWVGMSVALMLGAQLSRWVLKIANNERKALIWAQLSIGFFATLTACLVPLGLIFGAFFVHEMARGIFRPLKDVYLHDNIPSSERATIVSCESIVHHVGGAIGLLLSGLLAKSAGIPTTWIIAGAVIVIGTLQVSRHHKHSR